MQKKFSYPVKVDELNQNEYKFKIDADQEERADICQILQIEGVEKFTAEIFLKLNLKQHLLHVWGNVCAVLELKSVITLENFKQAYNIPFELQYDTKATYKDFKEKDFDLDDDIPDIIENGVIDLADVAIEQIALNMDDYPRAKGEVFEDLWDAEKPNEAQNPFAVLQKLKK